MELHVEVWVVVQFTCQVVVVGDADLALTGIAYFLMYVGNLLAAYPAGFDFLFVYWYLIRFAGESPFSHSALDIKTLVMAALGTDYRESVKRNMPARWFDDLPHTHVALGREQLTRIVDVQLELDWREELCTAAETMHGGALMSLADAAGRVDHADDEPGATGTCTEAHRGMMPLSNSFDDREA